MLIDWAPESKKDRMTDEVKADTVYAAELKDAVGKVNELLAEGASLGLFTRVDMHDVKTVGKLNTPYQILDVAIMRTL